MDANPCFPFIKSIESEQIVKYGQRPGNSQGAVVFRD